MADFKFGDYVVYDPGYTVEVGRFVSYGKDSTSSFVCFSEGCTASSTPSKFLKPLDRSEYLDLKVSPYLGYHRFDSSCPDYDESCCFACKGKCRKESVCC